MINILFLTFLFFLSFYAKDAFFIKRNLNHIKQERSYGEFSRTFLLPENIDQSSVKAKFNNGLLEVNIMKKEPEQPKEYNINIE
jgi:HSP20 family molecular chaperone IbpA